MRLRSLRGSAAISKRYAANLGIDSSTIRKNRVLRALDLGFWAWQSAKLVLIKDVGRAGPVWRHAFVRFTENRVIRNSFLSGVQLEAGTGRGSDYRLSVQRPVRDCRHRPPV